MAEPGTPEYVSYVLLLSLMIGVIQLAMGVLRLGVLVNFLSHAVVSGFTSAAAIIIGLSQLKHLLGVDLKVRRMYFSVDGRFQKNVRDPSDHLADRFDRHGATCALQEVETAFSARC